MDRLNQVNGQFTANKPQISTETITVDGKSYPELVDHHPTREINFQFLKMQGWGYKDSGFVYDTEASKVKILGNRYMFGGKHLPNFAPFANKNMGIPFDQLDPKHEDIEVDAPVLNHAFLEELGLSNFSRRSLMKWERLFHSHGACVQEIWQIRYTKIDRYVDIVIYPNSTADCEHLVSLAVKHNVVLVPYGGGTNVTKSLMQDVNEKRMIVSVSMNRMNAVKWVNKDDNMACVQAGISGQDLERSLLPYGVTSGHEPDSQEFSTLGGWISTRASGMKKNTYGNIEDIVQNVSIVTPKGTYSKSQLWPRVSNGPDLNHIVMGSEGNLGIITEAVIKVVPLPEKRIYESMLFHDFEIGIKFMYAVSKTKCWPTSIRLVDNTQFHFGSALKPESESRWEDFIESAKKFFVTKIKGFDPDKMVACTMLFEGDTNWCEQSHKTIVELGKRFNGLVGGPENGMRGYLLTFLIAYVRDIAMDHYALGESFETSCPWSNVSELCRRVRARMFEVAKQQGFSEDRVWVSFRITQLYHTGAAIYVYLTLMHKGLDRSRVIEQYEVVEDSARDEVMACGGCISHHHGVGKIRKKFVDRTIPQMAIDWQKQIKNNVDPTNIFAINNTIPRSEDEHEKLRSECAAITPK